LITKDKPDIVNDVLHCSLLTVFWCCFVCRSTVVSYTAFSAGIQS